MPITDTLFAGVLPEWKRQARFQRLDEGISAWNRKVFPKASRNITDTVTLGRHSSHAYPLTPPKKGWKQRLEARFLLRSDDVKRFRGDVKICNFHRVDRHLLRGAMPQSELTFEKLKNQYKTHTIIDLRGPETTDARHIAYEKAMARKYGIRYVRIPMSSKRPPTERELTIFLKAVQTAADAGGTAYVHCKHGIDRSGVMAACYEILNGQSRQNAYRNMKKHGFNFIHRWKCPAQRRFIQSPNLKPLLMRSAKAANFNWQTS